MVEFVCELNNECSNFMSFDSWMPFKVEVSNQCGLLFGSTQKFKDVQKKMVKESSAFQSAATKPIPADHLSFGKK